MWKLRFCEGDTAAIHGAVQAAGDVSNRADGQRSAGRLGFGGGHVSTVPGGSVWRHGNSRLVVSGGGDDV